MTSSPDLTSKLSALKKRYTSQKERILNDWLSFLRFPSISTDPAYAKDVLACASWLQEHLETLGFCVERWEKPGFPVLFATLCHAGPDRPTVLIYNHYDVQPVDPLELWESPPFEPQIRDGQVYARGALDDKGQLWYVLEAVRLVLEEDGHLPINLKLCIEGEEESGGATLQHWLPLKTKELQADHLLIVDSGFHDPHIPMVSLGARGMIAMELTLTGSNTDLHSGTHGGIAFNPLHALVDLLSKVRNEDGSIAIPGFYDGILELSPTEKKAFNFSFDAASYQRSFDAYPYGGEQQYSPIESATLRPTIEINGLWGGYTGQGFKTVIPAKAHAKISCRLVPGQDPNAVQSKVTKFLQDHLAKGMQLSIENVHGSAQAVRTSPNSPTAQVMVKAFEAVLGVPCHLGLDGGSIPITWELAQASGADFALVGYGFPTDNIHAPNEHFGIDRLEHGTLTIALALSLF